MLEVSLCLHKYFFHCWCQRCFLLSNTFLLRYLLITNVIHSSSTKDFYTTVKALFDILYPVQQVTPLQILAATGNFITERGSAQSTDACLTGLGPLRTMIHEAQNISACEHNTGFWAAVLYMLRRLAISLKHMALPSPNPSKPMQAFLQRPTSLGQVNGTLLLHEDTTCRYTADTGFHLTEVTGHLTERRIAHFNVFSICFEAESGTQLNPHIELVLHSDTIFKNTQKINQKVWLSPVSLHICIWTTFRVLKF